MSVVTTGVIRADELVIGRRIVAAAFAGEPFAFGMFGDEVLERYAGMLGNYSDWPADDEALVMAARVDGHLLGVALATRPGRCSLCDLLPDPDAHPIDAEFYRRCAQAHHDAALPPHVHIQTVATDAAVQGTGIGRILMGALLAETAAWASATVLECLTTRRRFYERIGFEVVSEFDDPGGPGLRALLMRLGN